MKHPKRKEEKYRQGGIHILYDDQCNKIEPKQLSKEITNFWRQIYQMHKNIISIEGNTEKSEYTQTFYDIKTIAQF